MSFECTERDIAAQNSNDKPSLIDKLQQDAQVPVGRTELPNSIPPCNEPPLLLPEHMKVLSTRFEDFSKPTIIKFRNAETGETMQDVAVGQARYDHLVPKRPLSSQVDNIPGTLTVDSGDRMMITFKNPRGELKTMHAPWRMPFFIESYPQRSHER